MIAGILGAPDDASAPGADGTARRKRPMRFVDEYRDPTTARALVAQITALAGDDTFKFMEVCGATRTPSTGTG